MVTCERDHDHWRYVTAKMREYAAHLKTLNLSDTKFHHLMHKKRRTLG